MYLLDILGILKRSKERIQLRARLYYSSEYPFFVLNAFLENRGTFKFQVPNQTPLRKWSAKKWYRWTCSNTVQQSDDTNLFPPVWAILGLGLCVVGFFWCCFFFFSQSNKNSENFRTFFFFCGNKLFPILFSFSQVVERNIRGEKKPNEHSSLFLQPDDSWISCRGLNYFNNVIKVPYCRGEICFLFNVLFSQTP